MKITLLKYCDVIVEDHYGVGFHKYGPATSCLLRSLMSMKNSDYNLVNLDRKRWDEASTEQEDGSMLLSCGCKYQETA